MHYFVGLAMIGIWLTCWASAMHAAFRKREGWTFPITQQTFLDRNQAWWFARSDFAAFIMLCAALGGVTGVWILAIGFQC